MIFLCIYLYISYISSIFSTIKSRLHLLLLRISHLTLFPDQYNFNVQLIFFSYPPHPLRVFLGRGKQFLHGSPVSVLFSVGIIRNAKKCSNNYVSLLSYRFSYFKTRITLLSPLPLHINTSITVLLLFFNFFIFDMLSLFYLVFCFVILEQSLNAPGISET